MIKKILKNNRGITLVEIIAALFIFTIIAASVAAVLVPTLRAFARANDLAEINTLLDNLSREIISDFSTANNIDTAGNRATITKANGVVIEYSEIDGRLHRGDMPILSSEFYRNKTMQIGYPLQGPTEYSIEIIIFGKDGVEMVRREYTVKPALLQPN